MATTYLLPCSCGRKVPVEPRHAGEVVRCSCGASLAAPTMLEMAALERAEPEASTRRAAKPWGVRQSLSLLGAAIFLAALAPVVYLLANQPPPLERGKVELSPAAIRRETHALTPLQTWRVWQSCRVKGPDARTPFEEQFYDEILRRYREGLLRWRLSVGVVVLIGVVGLGLVVIPLWKK